MEGAIHAQVPLPFAGMGYIANSVACSQNPSVMRNKNVIIMAVVELFLTQA